MTHPFHRTAVAIVPLLLATTVWQPVIDAARGPLTSAQGSVAATYALPLAA